MGTAQLFNCWIFRSLSSVAGRIVCRHWPWILSVSSEMISSGLWVYGCFSLITLANTWIKLIFSVCVLNQRGTLVWFVRLFIFWVNDAPERKHQSLFNFKITFQMQDGCRKCGDCMTVCMSHAEASLLRPHVAVRSSCGDVKQRSATAEASTDQLQSDVIC